MIRFEFFKRPEFEGDTMYIRIDLQKAGRLKSPNAGTPTLLFPPFTKTFCRDGLSREVSFFEYLECETGHPFIPYLQYIKHYYAGDELYNPVIIDLFVFDVQHYKKWSNFIKLIEDLEENG